MMPAPSFRSFAKRRRFPPWCRHRRGPWFVEDEEAGTVAQPFADDDLLLVASGHAGGRHAAARGLDPKAGRSACRRAISPRLPD